MIGPEVAAAEAEVAVEFIRAFNDRDLEAFAAVVGPEVEIHSMRGLRRGREEARKWATRAPGGAQQTILIDGLHGSRKPDGTIVLVASITRRWHWEEDGSAAGEEEMAWAFDLRDGLVQVWKPFELRHEALAHAGLDQARG